MQPLQKENERQRGGVNIFDESKKPKDNGSYTYTLRNLHKLHSCSPLLAAERKIKGEVDVEISVLNW